VTGPLASCKNINKLGEVKRVGRRDRPNQPVAVTNHAVGRFSNDKTEIDRQPIVLAKLSVRRGITKAARCSEKVMSPAPNENLLFSGMRTV